MILFFFDLQFLIYHFIAAGIYRETFIAEGIYHFIAEGIYPLIPLSITNLQTQNLRVTSVLPVK